MSGNNIDIVGLLNWATEHKGKTQRGNRRRERYDKDVDLITLLHKKKQEAQMLEHFIKDQEKLSKKEERKQGMSALHLAMFLIGTTPITGPLYVWFVGKLLGIH